MTEVEFDFDSSVARLLDRYASPPRRQSNWSDVILRAGLEKPRRSRRLLLLAAALAGLVALTLATPLGGALRRTVADFSEWLSGEPGAPVSTEEQQAFEEANRKSWNDFPGSPQLRRLTRTEIDGVTYDLLGFRSGGALCVRLVASGEARGSTLMCAPADDLRHDDVPVRVLFADSPFGRGEKKATVGFNEYRAARAQVTAGIAADGVDTVELVDRSGSHEVPVRSNSFLYVAERPEVGQRVTHIRARLENGRLLGVPFAPSPSGPAPSRARGNGEPGGPTVVERIVEGGTIGWFMRKEPRGEPLRKELWNVLPGSDEPDFGRLITPDPGSSKRIAISLDLEGDPRFPGSGFGIWYSVISRGGAGGSRLDRDNLFPTGPFTFSYGSMGAGDQYATFAGLASDDVARLEIFTATGNQIDVALKDNAYLAEVALARFPAKLVAYDAQGRVIGIKETHREEGPFTVVGAPIRTMKASAEGTTLAIRVHRTAEGGECWFAKATGSQGGNMNSCTPERWTRAPLRVGWLGDPPLFIHGRAREDITKVEIRYRDGGVQAITPKEGGYVLELVQPEQRRHDSIQELVGLDADGDVVARERVPPPARPPAPGASPSERQGPLKDAEWRAVIDDWYDNGSFEAVHRCAAVRKAVGKIPGSGPSQQTARKAILAYADRIC